ncbi:MAG: hypothetical protein EHM39_12105 [Chloroflexi bacterium]|nr:MAG: hypothetical protein EHM39_12105 [Chloroflexota bacterium]
MASIGVDCDITLTHPAVNGGAPVGFVAKRRGNRLVMVKRQAYMTPDGTYSDRIWFWVTVVCSDDIRNPDGSKHAATRSQIYSNLLAFLAARTGITLTCGTAVWNDLYATLTTTQEYLGQDSDELILSLNNGAMTQTAPIDHDRFANSLWDGPLTWETSYWR